MADDNLAKLLPSINLADPTHASLIATLKLKRAHNALMAMLENQRRQLERMKSDLHRCSELVQNEMQNEKKDIQPSASAVMAVVAPDAIALDTALLKARASGNFFAVTKSDAPAINEEARARREFEEYVKFDYRMFRWDPNKELTVLQKISIQLQGRDFPEVDDDTDGDMVLQWFLRREQERKVASTMPVIRRPDNKDDIVKKKGKKAKKMQDDPFSKLDRYSQEQVWLADPFRYVFMLRENKDLEKEEQIRTIKDVSIEQFDDPVDWELITEEPALQYQQIKPTLHEVRNHFYQFLRPSRGEEWTTEELERLTILVKESALRPWTTIATIHNYQEQYCHPEKAARTPYECIQAFYGADKLGKHSWTPGEDARLTELVEMYGTRKWQFIAGIMGHRTGPQCMHRWTKTLSSRIMNPKVQAVMNNIRMVEREFNDAVNKAQGRALVAAAEAGPSKRAPKTFLEGKKVTYWNNYLDRLLSVAVKAYTVSFEDAKTKSLMSDAMNAAIMPGGGDDVTEDEEDTPRLVTAAAEPKTRGRPPVESAVRWSMVQLHIPGKLDTQCRERYTNSVAPHIDHGEWGKEELELLRQKVDEMLNNPDSSAKTTNKNGTVKKTTKKNQGISWAVLVKQHFPHRTDAQLRRAWTKFIQGGAPKKRKRVNGDSDEEEDLYGEQRRTPTPAPKRRKQPEQAPENDDGNKRRSKRLPKPKLPHDDFIASDSEGEYNPRSSMSRMTEDDFVSFSVQTLPQFETQPISTRTLKFAERLLAARDAIMQQDPAAAAVPAPAHHDDFLLFQNARSFVEAMCSTSISKLQQEGALARVGRQ
eukprot:TRINITY_DN6556_c0_g1_i1.p1 TRINITY_DN6556_c0_g1~~TRINITY_DN6556_c0_g1_i1.p1  ORF type:complete len:819 (-),score=187.11 TRINITY_DN6556_c0_g1_i1:52-2508(-)